MTISHDLKALFDLCFVTQIGRLIELDRIWPVFLRHVMAGKIMRVKILRHTTGGERLLCGAPLAMSETFAVLFSIL